MVLLRVNIAIRPTSATGRLSPRIVTSRAGYPFKDSMLVTICFNYGKLGHYFYEYKELQKIASYGHI